jgi:hypothetical protein
MTIQPKTRSQDLTQAQAQSTSPTSFSAYEHRALLTVARRMFQEGFKRSMILRITGLSEEEFMGMMREIHCPSQSTVSS